MTAIICIAVLNLIATAVVIATRRTPRSDRARMRRTLAWWVRGQGK